MISLVETVIDLMGEKVDWKKKQLQLSKLSGGINSSVYRVDVDGEAKVVLKKYRSDIFRDRRKSEFNFLNFLNEAMPGLSPKIINTSKEKNVSLLEWIPGSPCTNLYSNDIKQFVDFQIELDRLKISEKSDVIGFASDVVLSPMDLIIEIKKRYENFDNSLLPQDVNLFLKEEFLPFFEKRVEFSIQNFNSYYSSFDKPISKEEQTIIASDFGTHNCLKVNDGKLIFIDFEYAGWDNPITSIANFMLHPGMNRSYEYRIEYLETLFEHFNYIKDFKGAYNFLLPLFCLRWCLIVLNIYKNDPAILDKDQSKEDYILKRKKLLLSKEYLMKSKYYSKLL